MSFAGLLAEMDAQVERLQAIANQMENTRAIRWRISDMLRKSHVEGCSNAALNDIADRIRSGELG